MAEEYKSEGFEQGADDYIVKPVSYTHLDVYKRQEIARKAVSFIREGECIILDSGSTTTEIAKLLTPVSYTHLDVYKRQIQL